MEYSEDVTVYGITGYRYVTSERLMDNGTIDPSTQCNCGGECLPQGVINTTECMLSSPSYVSYPHFLDADPIYRHQVKGMKPDPDIHRFYITVEPVSSRYILQKVQMIGSCYLLTLLRCLQTERCTELSSIGKNIDTPPLRK